MAAATADWSAVMQRHEAVLLEAISCIDNPCGSQVSINAITGRRKCICTLHCKCGPTLYEPIQNMNRVNQGGMQTSCVTV